MVQAALPAPRYLTSRGLAEPVNQGLGTALAGRAGWSRCS
jgi:hypothetical protein